MDLSRVIANNIYTICGTPSLERRYPAFWNGGFTAQEYSFLREINEIKGDEGTIKEKNPKISGFIKGIIVGVLVGTLVLSLLAAFISMSSYPKKISIGDNKYILVEDSANN